MIGVAYATPIKACQNTRLSLRTSRILTAFWEETGYIHSNLSSKTNCLCKCIGKNQLSDSNKLYVAILFLGTKKGRFCVIICVLCLFKFLKY